MTPQDQHDLDKLTRWREGLASGEGSFPAFAAFLVTESDRDAHNVFRQYRSAFEELGAAYHHLVIFGQHGASSTSKALLGKFGPAPADVPLLALIPEGAPPSLFTLALPKGETGVTPEQSQVSNGLLEQITEAARRQVAPEFYGVEGLVQAELAGGSVASLVELVFAEVDGASS